MAHVFKGNIVDDEQYPMPIPKVASQTRSQSGGPAQPQVDPAEVTHATSELQQMLDMVGQMRPAVQQLSDAARAGAQQQGYADGIARAQQEVQAQLIETMAALTDAQVQRHQFAEQNQAELADLAMKIARAIISTALELDPSIVGQIVANSLSDLEPTTAMTVQVHPDDLAIVEQHREEIERMVSGPGRVDIEANPNVDRGGCILASPVGEVDARIETKFSILEAAFAAQRRALQMGLDNAHASYESEVDYGAHAAPAYEAPAETYVDPYASDAVVIDDSGYAAAPPAAEDAGGGYLSAPPEADSGGYLSAPPEESGGGDYLNF